MQVTVTVPRMVTIKAAAEATGLTSYCIRQWCINKTIKSKKSNTKYYVNMESLAAYLNEEGDE